jgi:hypothetical protein
MTATTQLTADHLRIRDTVRAHFGDKWRTFVDGHRDLFALVMKHNKCSALEVVSHLTRPDPPGDEKLAKLIAVAVELTEERL